MRFLALWGPVLFIMALIFSLSAMPDPGAPPGGMSDKTAHLLVYAALGAAMIRALAAGRSAAMTAGRVAMAACLVALFGLSDEIHQAMVPNRTPEAMDFAADCAGGVLGAALFSAGARGVHRLRRAP